MSLIFDAILLIVAAVIVIVSAKRGFVKSMMHLGSVVVSLFVSYAFTPRLAAFFNEKFFLPKLASGLSSTIRSAVAGGGDLSKHTALVQILEKYKVDPAGIQAEIDKAADGAADAIDALSSTIAGGVSSTISSVCAFLALFIACVLVLKLVTFILDALFKLPVLKTANSLLGAVFGAACALFVVWALSLAFVHLIGALESVNPNLFGQDVIEHSTLLKFLSQNNVLTILSSLFVG